MQNLLQSMNNLLNTTLNLLKPPRSDPIKGVRVMSRRKLLWVGICFLQCCIFLLLDNFYPGDKYYFYRYNNMRTSFNLIIYVLLWQKTQYSQKEEDIKYLICVLTGVMVNIRPISFSYSMLILNAVIGLQFGLCFFYIKQVYGMWAEGSTRTGEWQYEEINFLLLQIIIIAQTIRLIYFFETLQNATFWEFIIGY